MWIGHLPGLRQFPSSGKMYRGTISAASSPEVLRVAKFTPWLDEEEIWGGDIDSAIATAARQSDFGLFIVSKRWLERPYTLHEVRLFKDRPAEKRVVWGSRLAEMAEACAFFQFLPVAFHALFQ
jgi:hypothetical protein